MIEEAFFKKRCNSISIGDLLSIIDADLEKNEHLNKSDEIFNISTLDEASFSDVSFLDNLKYKKKLLTTSAKFVIVSEEIAQKHSEILNKLVISSDPYLSIAKLAENLYGHINSPEIEDFQEKNGYFIHKTAKIGKNVQIGKGAVIHKNVEISDGVKIFYNTAIYENCKIGENSIIYENCSVRFSRIGKNCIIHPGVRIGQDGFGFAHCKKTKQLTKITHLGIVLIGNNVEIGANTTVDRGSFSNTIIEDNVKLDNLIQIGHNVKIGNSTVMAAQSAVAGSSKIGIGCMIGGQVGISGHLEIGNFVQIAGGSGITSDVKDGAILGGYPATDIMTWKRASITLYNTVKKSKNGE